jgi:DNA-binding response OmpR family regulator
MSVGEQVDNHPGARGARTGAVAAAQNEDMPTVLVVEDHRDIRELLRRYLERAAMEALVAATGAEAMTTLAEVRPDLILLDLGLPDMDGAQILQRARPRIPVILLTARVGTDERIAGFRAGADDYVIKPFSPDEVVLRVRAVLARQGAGAGAGRARSFGSGRLRIDPARHEVLMQGRDASLTPSEWSLLLALASAPGRVFTRAELVERLAGGGHDGNDRAVDTHIKNLRRKFDDHSHSVIETVVGFGYRLVLHPDE